MFYKLLLRAAPPLNYSVYTSRQLEAQQKAEGLKRLQAGVHTPACNLNAPSGLPLGDVYKESSTQGEGRDGAPLTNK